MNLMKNIRIEKVTLNCGVGESGEKLDHAVKLLQKITNQKPVKTKTMKRIPTWGIRPKLNIGCKVTLRHEKAEKVLGRLLKAVDYKVPREKFDDGNFSFGIEEYILIPEVEYDPEIGIIGLNVAVTLERPGFRVKRKRIKSKIPKRHKITKEESIEFMKNKFNIREEEE